MSAYQFNDEYDSLIRKASALYLPQWSWLWLKAELIAESNLDPHAVSGAGAQGIAQFMPLTWLDMQRLLKLDKSATPFDPLVAIPAAAFYLARLRGWWSRPRPEEDRRKLTQASYNAGFGKIEEAQSLASGATGYEGIVRFLPRVTGAVNAKETTDYVANIAKYYALLFDAECEQ